MNSLEYSLRTETLTKYFHECKRSKKYENDDNEKIEWTDCMKA